MNLERLLYPWKAGDACVASLPIFYAIGCREVAEGTEGVIEAVDRSSVCHVRWQGERSSFATSPESIHPPTDQRPTDPAPPPDEAEDGP